MKNCLYVAESPENGIKESEYLFILRQKCYFLIHSLNKNEYNVHFAALNISVVPLTI